MTTEQEDESYMNEAMHAERALTFSQVMLAVSLATGAMNHTDLALPAAEPSQMLELERLGILAAEDKEGGATELRLTARGRAMVRWWGAVMLETLGVDLGKLT